MGSDNKCYRASRIILIIFNVVFFAFGIALLSLGIYAKVNSTKYDDYLTVMDQSNSTWENVGGLGIGAGIICILLGFTGLVGVLRDNKPCLIVFLVIVTLILILELVGGGLALGFEDKIKDKARDGMFRTIVKYDNNTNSDITEGWDRTQRDLHCCGVTNKTDWEKNDAYSEGEYPQSCYCTNVNGCPNAAFQDVFSKGCYDSVVDEVQGSWKSWGGALIAFAVIQLIGIIACIVVIRNNGKAGYYMA